MVISTAVPDSGEHLISPFASRYVRNPLPRFRMPEKSTPKEAACQVINDELMLDGNPRLNLASFVTTWMEPECDQLIMASLNKNYVDMDEYPVTTELQVLKKHRKRRVTQPSLDLTAGPELERENEKTISPNPQQITSSVSLARLSLSLSR